MIYFDGVHLASPDIKKLHEFADWIGLKRCWFEGTRKKHPHYDVVNPEIMFRLLEAGVVCVSSRELVWYCFRT